VGWGLFAWGWQRALSSSTEAATLRALIIGVVLVVPVLTLSWIAHNRGIYRRKGPRREVQTARLHYESDFNGRLVLGDWAALANAQRVEIHIEGDNGELKRYRTRGSGSALDARDGQDVRGVIAPRDAQPHQRPPLQSAPQGGA
jgi:hypothetical protein